MEENTSHKPVSTGALSSGNEMTAADYLRTFRRRFWLLLLITVVVTAVVAVISWNEELLPDTYRATSRLLMERSSPGVLDRGDLGVAGPRQWFQTQINIMSSRTLVGNAAEQAGYRNLRE